MVVFESSVVKIVCISDTHNDHPTAAIPAADILLHAGDMTDNGSSEELEAAYLWLASLPHPVKVIVAGNHDLGLDPSHISYSKRAHELFTSKAAQEAGLWYIDRQVQQVAQFRSSNGSIKPVRVYGNPCQPDFLASKYCFTYKPYPDPASQAAWTSVPSLDADVDLWLTHSPPKDRLDAIDVPPLTGCDVLAKHVATCRPKLVVFGHYHSSYGLEKVTWQVGGAEVDSAIMLSKPGGRECSFDLGSMPDKMQTVFANAAWMTMEKRATAKRNLPWILTLDLENREEASS